MKNFYSFNFSSPYFLEAKGEKEKQDINQRFPNKLREISKREIKQKKLRLLRIKREGKNSRKRVIL